MKICTIFFVKITLLGLVKMIVNLFPFYYTHQYNTVDNLNFFG